MQAWVHEEVGVSLEGSRHSIGACSGEGDSVVTLALMDALAAKIVRSVRESPQRLACSGKGGDYDVVEILVAALATKTARSARQPPQHLGMQRRGPERATRWSSWPSWTPWRRRL